MSKGVPRAVGMIAALIVVAGCGSTQARSHTTITTHPAVAGLAPGASHTLKARLCATSQLAITLHGLAGLGHGGFVLEFQDRGRPCALYGYPGVDGLDRHGRAVVSARRTLRGYLGGLAQGVPEKAVTLSSGQTASAILEGLDAPLPSALCRHYTSLLITPPGETHSVRFEAGHSICYPQIHPVVPGMSGRET